MLSLTGAKKGSSLAVRPKTSMIPAAKISNSKKTVGSKSNYLQSINVKVLEIESMITTKLIREKTKTIKDRKKAQKEDRNEQEKDLEKGKDPGKKNIKIPKVPKLGMFGWLKRFIGSIILAYFASKMIDNLPKLVGLVKGIQNVIEFVSDIGIKLVDGLATFVDWGYKAYDATQGFLKNFGVKQEQFDQFSGALSGLIDALIIGSVILAARGEDGFGPGGLDKARRPGGRKPGVTTGRGGQKPRFRNPFGRSPVTRGGKPGMPGAPVSQGRGGKGPRPRIPGTGPRVTGGTPGTKPIFRRLPGLKGMNPNIKGGLLTAIFAAFEFGGRKGAGQTNLQAGVGTAGSTAGGLAGMKAGAAAGAALGTFIFPGVGTAIGGVLGGLLGGYGGSILGGAAADKLTGAKGYQEGGKVRKKTSRKLKKKRRTLNINRLKRPSYRPIPSAPKEDIKNQDGESNRAWWDFLGWAGTSDGNVKLSESGAKLGTRVSEVGNTLGKNDYFGPLLSLTSKIILNKDIASQDYDNIGLGINRLINEGILKRQISEGISGYAEGGKIASALAAGIDASSWVSDTFKKELSSDIKGKYEKIGVTGSSSGPGSTSGPGSAPGVRDSATGELQGGTAGGAISPSQLFAKIGANAEQWDIFRNSVALIESNGDYSIPGGSGMHYDGRYQMGAAAKKDGARYAGLDYPGHSDDPNAQVRAAYRADKELQEAIFTGFTLANHTYLMRNETYKNSTIERKLQILGYAHNQGMGGAEKWITTGVVGKDGFGTKGTKYTDLIAANFRAKKSGGDLQIAEGAVSVPSLPDEPGNTDTSGSGNISASGSGVVAIGKDLASKGFAVAEHPDFTKNTSGGKYTPGKGSVSNVHKGAGHYDGRAIDVTDHRGSLEDSKARYRSVLTSLQDNPAINMLIHDSWGGMYAPGQKQGPGAHGHPTHMHIETKRSHAGTKLSNREQMLKILPGQSLLDENTSKSLGATNLARFNAASTPEEMKKIAGQIAGVSDYAPYEQGAQQTIVVNNNNQEQPMDDYGTQDQGLSAMMGNSYDNSFEFLDYQG